jgi:glucosamine kinase
MSGPLVIGVDGGGTRTRAVILDADGVEVGRAATGPALMNRQELPIDIDGVVSTVRSAALAADFELPAAALCAGFAGVGREQERQAVEEALGEHDLAKALRVVTDAEAAFFDAFRAGPGLLLIAGTGSVALGRAEDGRQARVGGWGLLLGDEGSAYEIGLRAMRAIARSADGRSEPTQLLAQFIADLSLIGPEDLIAWAAGAGKKVIASLAPAVCDLAAAGDAAAAAIVSEAVASLATHVDALIAQLGPWSSSPGLALAGGLLAMDRPLREPLAMAVAERPCVLLDTQVAAVRGAALMALAGFVPGPTNDGA